MAIKRGPVLKLFWRIHRRLFKASKGRLGTRVNGMPILLLTTIGRKSGRPRENALMYGPSGDSYVVIASNAGASFHSAWWLNLEANPEAEVMVGGKVLRVQAREAAGAECERLWDQMVRENGDYDEYKQMTTRHIPVVVLDPIS